MSCGDTTTENPEIIIKMAACIEKTATGLPITGTQREESFYMKKAIASSLVLAFVGLALGAILSVPCTHNHAEAAVTMVNWQCERCGQRAWLRQGTMPARTGCGFDLNRPHIWRRM